MQDTTRAGCLTQHEKVGFLRDGAPQKYSNNVDGTPSSLPNHQDGPNAKHGLATSTLGSEHPKAGQKDL